MDSGPLPRAFRHILLPETGSTNDDCLKLADAGAPDGTLVRALHQTGGRGRGSRSWFSRPGASLTFSVLLRPEAREYAHLTRFALLGCLALARALSRNFSAEAQIKWPNDVLLSGKKVCGVLTEALWQDQLPSALVLGMGVNLTDEALPPQSETIFPAGSLAGQAGIQVSAQALLEVLLPELARAREELPCPGFLAEVNARLACRGEWVSLRSNADAPFRARPISVEADGSLWAEGEDGRMARFYSAEISG
ncbi:MAG TPA: biotin--[acetyl-CoA-carboxylase] ligase [Anaerolineaceae bacterium]|nr:biotin--[acetyl-CoA-carboxylase] ligase [Anaerolineaceae bacterium]